MTFGTCSILLVAIATVLYAAATEVSGEEEDKFGKRNCIDEPEGFIYCSEGGQGTVNKNCNGSKACLEGAEVKCLPLKRWEKSDRIEDVCFCDAKLKNPKTKYFSVAICGHWDHPRVQSKRP